MLPNTTLPERTFFYDNDGNLVKATYNSGETFFAYHNGRMDSIYYPTNPDVYTLLEYDSFGNVV